MESVKQFLYDMLVEEFNAQPSFLLARTLFLFCHFNPSYEMPTNIKERFIKGLMEDEVRAFGLRYDVHEKAGQSSKVDESMNRGKVLSRMTLKEKKEEIYSDIAAENLTKGTGKTYSSSMVKDIATKFRGVMSYNEILEIFIMSGR